MFIFSLLRKNLLIIFDKPHSVQFLEQTLSYFNPLYKSLKVTEMFTQI